jgi:TonB family protein
MNTHLSEQGVSMYVIGDASVEERQHAEECAECQAKIAGLLGSLAQFRGAVRSWSDRAEPKDRAAELHWTVIPPADPLERMLLPTLETPWYRSLWHNVRDSFSPAVPLMDITAKPVIVRDIWGQYGRQKKSWAMSLAIQCAALGAVVALASTPQGSRVIKSTVSLVMPSLDEYQPKSAPKKVAAQGGGGGGDRSPLPASLGRLPKAALKQFTPPMAVVANLNPKLAMEPSIIAPPDVQLPQVNMLQYGDPLGKLGPASNGPGSGGGIGSGTGGGVGSGKDGGFGPGEGGGFGGGVYRLGGGVSAPALLTKVEPEYSEEARKAKHQGTVVLYVEVDTAGRPHNIRVVQSLGLGLDEKAMEAVAKWKFKPGLKDGRPVTVAATVEVTFRLL